MSLLTYEVRCTDALRRLADQQAELGDASIKQYLDAVEADDFDASLGLKMAVYEWFLAKYGPDCLIPGLALDDCPELGIADEDWYAYSGADVASSLCYYRVCAADAASVDEQSTGSSV